MTFIFRWKYVIAWFIWAMAIFVGSSIPGQSLPDFSVFSSDKLLHAGIYAVFTLLGIQGLKAVFPASSASKIYFFIFLINGFYAITDEWHQSFVPNRSCDFFDAVADVAGILIAIGLYHYYTARIKMKTN